MNIFFREITLNHPYRICFVCLGNICRSPTAEAIFIHLIKEQKTEDYFEVDSAGMEGYHTGEKAHSMARSVAKSRGIEIRSRARKFIPKDLDIFDMILAMDSSNLSALHGLDRFSKNRNSSIIQLIRYYEIDRKSKRNHIESVPDPYFSNKEGFIAVFEMLYRCCTNLLKKLYPHIKK